MKKVVFVLCLYSSQIFSQEIIERTYSIQEEPEIYFFQFLTNNCIKEAIHLIKSDYKSEDLTTTKTGKVDPPNGLNPFPDPFSSSIKVNIPGNLICNFSLSSVTGEVIFKTQIFGERSKFNLSFLPEGIYLASVSTR